MYSGVAGMDLAILAATEPHGRIVWHCENAAYPRAVLAERFPGVPCYESDEAIDANAPPIDILIGGPPCQPTSTAGKRKGAADDRWRWPQFMRVVGLLRPQLVFLENPASLLTSGLGGDFTRLSDRLESHRWPATPGPQFDHEPPRTVETPKGGGRHSPVSEVFRHRRARLKALGNSCCPQQALAAWRELVARIR